jgi:serine/threonine-protein kinase
MCSTTNTSPSTKNRTKVGLGAILAAVFVGLLICGLFTAWRNIRLGRADKKGAWKLFFWVFCWMFLTRVLGAHFNSSIASLVVLLDCIRFALSLALATWIVYIAIEPYVRKFWPELSISWSRLLAGDVKDPLVGRDVLVGVSLGLAHACWLYILQLLLFDANGFAEPIAATTVDPLFGFRGLAMIVTETLSASVFYTTMLFLLVVLVSAILKRRWQAAFAIWCVEVALVTRLFTFEWGYEALVAAAVVATILCVAKLRFGMLAFLSYLVVMRLSYFVPLTTDTSSWYFNVTVLSAVVIIGLAVYGFYTSIAGQKLWQGKLLGDGD